jgi:two-component system, OmpR family, sensor kinase
MMFKTIRTKLTLWYSGVLALVIIVFAVSTYFLLVRTLDKNADVQLVEMAENFKVTINSEQTDEAAATPDQVIAEAINEFRFQDFKFSVLDDNGKLIKTTSEDELPQPDLSKTWQTVSRRQEHYRVFADQFKARQNQYKLLVYEDLRQPNNLKELFLKIFSVTVPLAVLLAGLGGYFLARKSLEPILEMSARAKRISATNLYERLPIANENDEVGHLATIFNDLLNRLETAFEQQRRFMADASHELRTPLSILRGESEVTLSKNDRTTEEYQEALAIVHDESKRLTKIVEDLFTLARADSGQFKPELRDVYLDEIVADCVRSIRVLAEKRKIGIKFSAEETRIKGNEKLLHRLFLNLLDNAVKYNHEEGNISIVIKNKQVIVTNTGPRIPSDEQSKIFERFYRVDKARSRRQETNTSGAGLGLSISTRIAEIHQAELELLFSNSKETSFSVTFPS